MRRFLRRFFMLCAALSLLLCVATGVLWVRSDTCYDSVQVHYVRTPQPDDTRSLFFEASSAVGTLRFTLGYASFEPVYLRRLPGEIIRGFRVNYPPGMRWRVSGGPEMMKRDVPPPGFRARHYRNRNATGHRADRWILAVPHWLAMAMLLVMPVIWMIRFRNARRARRLGLCATCGYDLRASAQRCPECGSEAPQPARSATAM